MQLTPPKYDPRMGRVHLYPWREKHNTNALDCWCSPRVMSVCPACGGEACELCENGWIDNKNPAPDDPGPVLVIHHKRP